MKVSYHELLGHGCGKLFCEDNSGKLNFDRDTVVHPLTRGKINSWYKVNETWSNVFLGFSNPYEECRVYIMNNIILG
jgi:dipeptidyl-peptidase-3